MLDEQSSTGKFIERYLGCFRYQYSRILLMIGRRVQLKEAANRRPL